MSQDIFKQIWGESPEQEDVHIPAGGNFVRGIVGPYKIRIYYSFWSETMLEDLGLSSDMMNRRENGTFYYWKSYADAVEVSKAMGRTYDPNTVWRWETPVSAILGAGDEFKATLMNSFGDNYSQEVQVTGLRARGRHEFHLLTLPSAIQALALVAGFITEPVFDYSSLGDLRDEHITEELEAKLIGNGLTGELGDARKRLWEALGEDDANTYTVKSGNPTDTVSPKLAQCLQLVYAPATIWAQAISIPNPSVAAVTKAGKRLRCFVVTGIWSNDDAAKEALDLGDDSTGTTATGGGLKVPSSWASMETKWREYVVALKKEYKGKPMAVVTAALEQRDQELRETYDAGASDFLAWWNEV